jgi:predicted metal-binding protein
MRPNFRALINEYYRKKTATQSDVPDVNMDPNAYIFVFASEAEEDTVVKPALSEADVAMRQEMNEQITNYILNGLDADEEAYLFDSVLQNPLMDIENGELDFRRAVSFIRLRNISMAIEHLKRSINQKHRNAMLYFATCFSKDHPIGDHCKTEAYAALRKRVSIGNGEFDLFFLLALTFSVMSMMKPESVRCDDKISFLESLIRLRKLGAFISRFDTLPEEMSAITLKIYQGGYEFYTEMLSVANIDRTTDNWLHFNDEEIKYIHKTISDKKSPHKRRQHHRYLRMFLCAPCLLSTESSEFLKFYLEKFDSSFGEGYGLTYEYLDSIQKISQSMNMNVFANWIVKATQANDISPMSYPHCRGAEYLTSFLQCLITNTLRLTEEGLLLDEIDDAITYVSEKYLCSFMDKHDLSFRNHIRPLYLHPSFFSRFDKTILNGLIPLNAHFNFNSEQKNELIHLSSDIFFAQQFTLHQTLEMLKKLNRSRAFTNPQLAFDACANLLKWMDPACAFNKQRFFQFNSKRKEYTNQLLEFLRLFKSDIDVTKQLVLQSNTNVRTFTGILVVNANDAKTYPSWRMSDIDPYTLKQILSYLTAEKSNLAVERLLLVFNFFHRIIFDKNQNDALIIQLLANHMNNDFFRTFQIFFNRENNKCSPEQLNKVIQIYPALAGGEMSDLLQRVKKNDLSRLLDESYAAIQRGGFLNAQEIIRARIHRFTNAYAAAMLPRFVRPMIPNPRKAPVLDLNTHKASTHFGSNLTCLRLFHCYQDEVSHEKIEETTSYIHEKLLSYTQHKEMETFKKENPKRFLQIHIGMKYFSLLNFPVEYNLHSDQKRKILSTLKTEKACEMFHWSQEDNQNLTLTVAQDFTFNMKSFMLVLFLECLSSGRYPLNNVSEALLIACYECARGGNITSDRYDTLTDSKLNRLAASLSNEALISEEENQQLEELIKSNRPICSSGHMNKLCEKLSSFSEKIHFLAVTETVIVHKIKNRFYSLVQSRIEQTKQTEPDEAIKLIKQIHNGDPNAYFLNEYDTIAKIIEEEIGAEIVIETDNNLLSKSIGVFRVLLSDLESISALERDHKTANPHADDAQLKKLMENSFPDSFITYIRNQLSNAPIDTLSSSSSADDASRPNKRKFSFFAAQDSSSSVDNQEEKEDMQLIG